MTQPDNDRDRNRNDEGQAPDTFDPNPDPNQPATGDDRQQPADPEANR